MKAINTNDAKQLRKAISVAPRGKRAAAILLNGQVRKHVEMGQKPTSKIFKHDFKGITTPLPANQLQLEVKKILFSMRSSRCLGVAEHHRGHAEHLAALLGHWKWVPEHRQGHVGGLLMDQVERCCNRNKHINYCTKCVVIICYNLSLEKIIIYIKKGLYYLYLFVVVCFCCFVVCCWWFFWSMEATSTWSPQLQRC